MKCHYEVLDVTKDADDGEIKSAYRKLALKWHPDKNLDNTEYAKEQFQLVQQAYEILSDRQERAWYDRHREQILRGGNSDYKDQNLDVFQYFTTTCFKGYGDDENGFYTVYRTVFEKIAEEDLEYMDDKEEFCNIPVFGSSTSDYEDVVGRFYDYWMCYSTKKSYVWLDPYNIKEAVNRRVLKLIDKENDKIRQKARKERNEEVRNLVAFVRKRDKRVQTYTKLLELKKLQNRQKQEKLSKLKRLERLKQLDESSEQAEWMKFENVKSELEEIEKKLAKEFGDDISEDEQNSNSEEEIDNFYCTACNKVFKNVKAFENHEFSKKHKENVEKLKEAMTEDEFSLRDHSSKDDVQYEEESDQNVSESENLSDEENLLLPAENVMKKKKNRKSKNVIRIDQHSDSEVHVNVAVENNLESEDSFSSNKKQKRKKRKDNKSNKQVLTANILQTEDKNAENHICEENINGDKRINKKKIKKDKKQNRKDHSDITEIDRDHCCVMCKANFESKNKLFDHLKKTGHSVYIPSSSKIEKSKKKVVIEK